MTTIPEEHKKYDLLRCGSKKKNWECFFYPSLSALEKLDEYELDPYGFASVEAYNEMIEERIKKSNSAEKIMLFRKLQEDMIRMNDKRNWSVCRFLGEDLPVDSISGLRKNKCYYWPCDIANPIYEGVIDEEEYTSYWYPTEPELWEILEDPTGMAYRTIYEKKNFASQKSWNNVMEQIKKL